MPWRVIFRCMLGLVVLSVAAGLFYYNESVKLAQFRKYDDGLRRVNRISADIVNPRMEGKLVWFSAPLATQPLKDNQTRINAEAVILKRTTLMYQWVELQMLVEPKRFRYFESWAEKFWSIFDFTIMDESRQNPTKILDSKVFIADPIKVGAFELPPDLFKQLKPEYQVLPMTEKQLALFPSAWKSRMQFYDKGFFLTRGGTPEQPKLGDMQIYYEVMPAGKIVSILGQQTGNRILPFVTKENGIIYRAAYGDVPPEKLHKFTGFNQSKVVWAARVLTILMSLFGLMLITQSFAIPLLFIIAPIAYAAVWQPHVAELTYLYVLPVLAIFYVLLIVLRRKKREAN